MGNREEFIAGLYPAARRVAQDTGMSWELILAQAAQETRWGQSVLPGTNNIFNIKADASWDGPRRTFNVREYINGQWVNVQADFRVYGSVDEALRDRVQFLRENPRYARAGLFDEGTRGDFQAEARALQRAGYATDPRYADALIEVFNGPTMRRALALSQERGQTGGVEAPVRPSAMADGLLKSGDRGPEVVTLQQQLNALGYRGRNGHELETGSGIFGPETEHALREFQRAHGLQPDGKAGNRETLPALAHAADHPLVSEATHPNHALYLDVTRRIAEQTGQPSSREAAANVTLQMLDNGIGSPADLRDVRVQGSMLHAKGPIEGDRVSVNLAAPTPDLQAMSDHMALQSQPGAREQQQENQHQKPASSVLV